MTDRTLLFPSDTYNPAHERQRNRRIEEVVRQNASNLSDQIRAQFVPACLVSELPAATAGVRGFVTNATAPSFGAAVTGGGTVATPVYFDGTTWRCG